MQLVITKPHHFFPSFTTISPWNKKKLQNDGCRLTSSFRSQKVVNAAATNTRRLLLFFLLFLAHKMKNVKLKHSSSFALSSLRCDAETLGEGKSGKFMGANFIKDIQIKQKNRRLRSLLLWYDEWAEQREWKSWKPFSKAVVRASHQVKNRIAS